MSIYIGVDGKARKVKSAYIGDAYGNAQVIYKAGIVPNGYIPVQYIYNDSGTEQPINTEIIPNAYTRLIVKCSFASSFAPGNSNYMMVGASYLSISGSGWSSSRAMFISAGSQYAERTITVDNIYTVDINKNLSKESYLNNEYLFKNQDPINTTNTITIFSQYKVSGFRLYSCAIYQSMTTGTLTKNYIPCIKIEGNIAGLWESVKGVFIGNSQYGAGDPIVS